MSYPDSRNVGTLEMQASAWRPWCEDARLAGARERADVGGERAGGGDLAADERMKHLRGALYGTCVMSMPAARANMTLEEMDAARRGRGIAGVRVFLHQRHVLGERGRRHLGADAERELELREVCERFEVVERVVAQVRICAGRSPSWRPGS